MSISERKLVSVFLAVGAVPMVYGLVAMRQEVVEDRNASATSGIVTDSNRTYNFIAKTVCEEDFGCVIMRKDASIEARLTQLNKTRENIGLPAIAI